MTERDDSLSFSEGMTNILELVCFQNGAPSVDYFLHSDRSRDRQLYHIERR